ncbi:MAG: endonuclease domain-containing protein [Sphingomicrobium sp.]
MKLTGPKETIERARALRKTMTKPERLLWWALRRNSTGMRFRRQHPAGAFVLDFYCDAARLCVEVDGKSHDFRTDHDRRRDAWLREQGVQTLRIAASDVLRNLDGVVALIVEAGARSRL